MKLTILILLMAVVGAASGAGLATWRFFSYPIVSPLVDRSELPTRRQREIQAGSHPKVEVDQEEYHFGAMDSHAVASHEFVFRNVGTAPLTLTKGQTTCKCTLSEIGSGRIPPGGTGIVKLEWSGKDMVGPYSQSATIITNDPERPAVYLRIDGEMTAKVRLFPEELVFSSITAGQEATADLRLFSYLEDPLTITAIDHEPADHFEVVLTDLPEDVVKKEEYATGGYAVRVTAKPGLPLGPLRGRIRLTTNAEELGEVSIPVKGVVSSEITVFGPDWHDEAAVLVMGTLTGDQSVRKRLFIRVGGTRPEEIEFEPVEIIPEYVQVRFGERTSPSAGRAAITPMEIEIPEGSPPGNYLGPKRDAMGRIRLKTTHPTARELDLYLKFLVR